VRAALTVAANSFRETVRERVLYNLVFFAVIMTFSGLLLRELSIRQDDKIVKDVGLASMEVFGTLIAIFIGVGLVSKEIERRSLYALLAKPLRREEFLLGKFLGLSFTLLVNVAVMTAFLYLTLIATSRRADPALLKAAYAIYLSLVLIVAVALLFSSVTSAALASVCAFVLVVAGRYSDVILNMKQVTEHAPGWLITVLYYGVPNFRNFDIKDRVVYGDPVAWATLGWATVYAGLYAGLALLLAVVFFRRREL
jgi:ABC-type transport system involved in multi-copper enzyme maturation permease subunit